MLYLDYSEGGQHAPISMAVNENLKLLISLKEATATAYQTAPHYDDR